MKFPLLRTPSRSSALLLMLLLAAIALTVGSVVASRRAHLLNQQLELARKQVESQQQQYRELLRLGEQLRNAMERERQQRGHDRKGDFWHREELKRLHESRELPPNAV